VENWRPLLITHDKIQSIERTLSNLGWALWLGHHQLVGELHRVWIQVRRWR
jgi:hypothetical protein